MNYMWKLLAGILCLWGCGEERLEGYGGGEGQVIALSGTIVQDGKSRVDDGGFCDGDVIGVYIVDYEGENAGELLSAGNRATNARFVYDEAANRWSGAYDIYWKDKETPVDVYGYYPYGEPEDVTTYEFAVRRDQSGAGENGRMGGYEASDFLWAKAEKATQDEQVIRLAFRHRMALARVMLEEGEGFGEGEWAGLEKQVLVTNTRRESVIDLRTGVVTVRGEVAETGIVPFEREGEFWAIVVPQEMESGTELFRITAGGTVYSFARKTRFTYTPGKMHNFTIQVNKKEAEGEYEFVLIGESVTAWERDPVSHDATAREYIIVDCEAGRLRECVLATGQSPKAVKNLKLTGEIGGEDFYFMRDSMASLEALNLAEVRIVAWPVGGRDELGRLYEDDKIPGDALMSKYSLRYLELPSQLKKIEQNAFASCTSLTGSLVIPEGVTEIGNAAFHSCEAFNGMLSLPSTLERIEDGAFLECRFVSELKLPDKLKYIGRSAFSGCAYLYGPLVLPEELTDLGDYAFYGCKRLSGSLRVPQGVTEVRGGTFAVCGFDGQLTLHDGIRSIGPSAFMSNRFRGELRLPEDLEVISESAFYDNTFSGTLALPERVSAIGDRAFGYNNDLSGRLVVPDGVRSIGAAAFAYTRLEEVVFPENLESILSSFDDGEGAFMGCVYLTRLVCKGTIPPLVLAGAFAEVPTDNVVLEVPETAIEQYRIAQGWSAFKRVTAYRELECSPIEVETLNRESARELTIRAEGEWEVAEIPDWCSLSEMSGEGRADLTLTVSGMAGEGVREGEVVFRLKGTDYTARCRVAQYGCSLAEDETLVLQEHSTGDGVVAVFVGDGFSAEEIASGEYMEVMNAQVEAFFELEPYRSYRDYFDVYARVAVSPESGIGAENTSVDTKFGTKYVSGTGLRCESDALFGYVAEIPEVEREGLAHTLVVLVPNTADYEGRTELWEDGSGIAYCPASGADGSEETRSAVWHEAGGHAFGKLADETIWHGGFMEFCNCACCPHADEIRRMQERGWYANVSLSGKTHEVPWAHLLEDSRYNGTVDIYEGAVGHMRGVYRSEQNSCMNDGVPYFNAASREAIVKRIMEYAGEVYSYEAFAAKDRKDKTEAASRVATRNGTKYGERRAVEVHGGKPNISR